MGEIGTLNFNEEITLLEIEKEVKKIICLSEILKHLGLDAEQDFLEVVLLEDMKMRILVRSVYAYYDLPKKTKNLTRDLSLSYREERFKGKKENYKPHYLKPARPFGKKAKNKSFDEFETTVINMTPKTLFPWYEYIVRQTECDDLCQTRKKVFKTAIRPKDMKELNFQGFLNSIDKENPTNKYINYSASFYAFNERMQAFPLVILRKKLSDSKECLEQLQKEMSFLDDEQLKRIVEMKDKELKHFIQLMNFDIMSKTPLTLKYLVDPITKSDLLLGRQKERLSIELWSAIEMIVRKVDGLIENIEFRRSEKKGDIIEEDLDKLLKIYIPLKNEHPYRKFIKELVTNKFEFDLLAAPINLADKELCRIAEKEKISIRLKLNIKDIKTKK